MNVLLTFDVEVWCDGWSDLDRNFKNLFPRYVYGRSRRGAFALPKTLEILNAHGLRATFFVEPLFAYRFGIEPLAEIVGLIADAGQDVQLHLHPEWADETTPRLVAFGGSKRPLLSQYSLEDQTTLIALGKDMLIRAGSQVPRAFRAGSYGCNRDTFIALARNALNFDSSLNPARAWSGADLPPSERSQKVSRIAGVIEYPITCYTSWGGTLRQVQVGSTSFTEFRHLLESASAQRRCAFVIVSHNFEMLKPDRSTPDEIVVRRFNGLCRFLADHRDHLGSTSFDRLPASIEDNEHERLVSRTWDVARRNLEQAWRRVTA